MQTIFTIGHSTHPLPRFIELLSMHNVEVIADVRSQPSSRFNPHFNREPLSASLRDNHIKYVFLGKELGARSSNPSCYVNGRADYNLIAKTPDFREGLRRIIKGAEHMRLALMCAEKDPLQCHRTILIARHLIRSGARIEHILPDGTIETQDDALSRLIKAIGVAPADMLRSESEVVDDAYRIQGDSIAFQERDVERESSRLSRTGAGR